VRLLELVRGDAKIEEIASLLDGLGPSRRLEDIHSLGANEQKVLFEMAGASPPLDLSFFVPPSVPDRHEVVHYGKNSQPAFRFFQKRWCRPEGRNDQLYGYNETFVRPLIGPGYFVARATSTEGGGRDRRGAVVVDYFKVPAGPVAEGWPEVRPNTKGLQRFVYAKTRDYMRRVSEHCSIGIAYRQERRVMGYFVLCRELLPDDRATG